MSDYNGWTNSLLGVLIGVSFALLLTTPVLASALFVSCTALLWVRDER
jgi:hypothetical protein